MYKTAAETGIYLSAAFLHLFTEAMGEMADLGSILFG